MKATMAHRMWATASEEHTFWSARDAVQIAKEQHARSFERALELGKGEVIAKGDDLAFITASGKELAISHHAFGRLASEINFPAEKLRELPATIVSDIVRHKARDVWGGETKHQGLIEATDDGLVLRDLASLAYARTWNDRALEAFAKLEDLGWKVPPGRPSPARADDPRQRIATEVDCLMLAKHTNGLSIKPGDLIAPCGVYASEDFVFTILIKEDAPVIGPKGKPLYPMIQMLGSELYLGRAWEIVAGYISGICGNHLLDGFQAAGRTKIRHLSDADDRAERAIIAAGTATIEPRAIEAMNHAAGVTIARELKDVVPTIWEKVGGRTWAAPLTKRRLQAALDVAVRREDWYGAPNTLWALHSGLTEVSQGLRGLDRSDMDAAASRILTIDI